MRPNILVVVGGGGGAVENVCGRHLKHGYNVCKTKLSFTSKNSLKVQQNCFFSHLELQNFHGGDPQTPLTREGRTPHVLSSHSCLRHSVKFDGVQWPYHFPKANDGPGLLRVILPKALVL